ncbi:MAG: sigma-70 family RNA polymerase sigma factor [Candidatus Omnitrophica bacterium]|nr:sigma-70 family RNA polymerase sigma factor [Candidatus Omnitrophota bacterium]MDD5593030.1 sigma-70 family RNA polymerase sigma factor [Candidatus Omnitrophota bacterium]
MYFLELIQRISPKLKGITHKLNGRFTFFNEDDLYQEALVHLWLGYKEGKLSGNTDSYILQGCYFYLKNYIRKTQDKAPLVSIHALVNEEDALELGETLCLEDPESSFERIHCKMLIEKINNNGLTKREKEVFRLSLEELTIREIGSRLGISHVRVVKLKGKIRDKCQKFKGSI